MVLFLKSPRLFCVNLCQSVLNIFYSSLFVFVPLAPALRGDNYFQCEFDVCSGGFSLIPLLILVCSIGLAFLVLIPLISWNKLRRSMCCKWSQIRPHFFYSVSLYLTCMYSMYTCLFWFLLPMLKIGTRGRDFESYIFGKEENSSDSSDSKEYSPPWFVPNTWLGAYGLAFGHTLLMTVSLYFMWRWKTNVYGST